MENSKNVRGVLAIAMLMLVAAFVVPNASAEYMIYAGGEGDNDMTSFGPASGEASFWAAAMNAGDEDYTGVNISASFDDESWTADMVYFDSMDGSNGNGTADLGSMAEGEIVYVMAVVSIPESAENGDSVSFTVTFVADQDTGGDQDSAMVEFTVVVTDWVAFSEDETQSFEEGDTEEDCAASTSCNVYTITVLNLNENDISNEITIGFAGADEGWNIAGDDWDEMSKNATLFGLAGDDWYNVSLEISLVGVNVPSGDATIAFQAHDDDGYIQPFFIVMNATVADFFDVKVSGSGSQSVAASGGDVNWNVTIRNMGNTGDSFDYSFDTSNADAAGWSTTGTDGGNTGYLDWKGSGDESEHSFTVSMSVPDGLGAGTSHGFTMSVSSSSGAMAATQSFSATVDQSYGLSLTCSACQATKAPGETAEFSFTITNDGNGEDSYAVVVGGPSAYSPASDAVEVTVAAGATGQFVVSAMVPTDKQAHSQSGDITVTVTSEDGATSASTMASVTTAQVFALAFDGGAKTASVAQDASVSVVFNLTNSGNGPETVTFALDGAPAFAALSATDGVVGPGQTITVTATIAPTADDATGSSSFTVTATGGSGTAVSSGTLTVDVTEKSTGGGDPGTDDIGDDEDEGWLPGFGLLAVLSALGAALLLRRR
ncbi:MAG TPA: hypothetical protein EYM67_03690 [Candidatus Poseidoniales archaeon]|nr:hypothetical protein [Candidatus Poseidoniales archaeon]